MLYPEDHYERIDKVREFFDKKYPHIPYYYIYEMSRVFHDYWYEKIYLEP